MLRNITLSAEESAIKAARECARRENTSLNALFRDWLEQYTARKRIRDRKAWLREYDALMERLSYVKIGRMPTREERNAR